MNCPDCRRTLSLSESGNHYCYFCKKFWGIEEITP